MADNPRGEQFTSADLLSRNVLINTMGQLIPLVAAVVSIPILIREIGHSRFGLLSLAWMVIGSFSLFDFGLGRAATKLIAEKLGAGRESEIPAVFWTNLVLMIAIGLAGSLVLFLATPWMVHSGLTIPQELQADTLRSFYLIAATIPVLSSTAGLLGALEAQQHFMLANAIRTPLGIFYFVGPLMALPFSHNLFPMVALLLSGRLVGWSIYFYCCLQRMLAIHRRLDLDPGMIWSLLRMGGWMTLSNLISPLMGALDRFLVGSLLSAAAVAYYATPLDVVVRILIIPCAFIGVFFPAFSTAFAMDRQRTVRLFQKGLKFLALAIFPVVLAVVTFGQEGLAFWLGDEFSRHSARVLPLLSIGVFFSSLALFPFALLQGVGRPDITAKLHLAECPLYVAGMWVLIGNFGIEGAALGWTLRAGVDAALLFLLSRRVMGQDLWSGSRAGAALVAALLSLLLSMALANTVLKIGFFLAAAFSFLGMGWYRMLSSEEQGSLRAILRRDVF